MLVYGNVSQANPDGRRRIETNLIVLDTKLLRGETRRLLITDRKQREIITRSIIDWGSIRGSQLDMIRGAARFTVLAIGEECLTLCDLVFRE